MKTAIALKMQLYDREKNTVVMKNTMGAYEEYEVLANFPFTSESKKMGILLKNKGSTRVVYFIKGAEVVVENKIKASSVPTLRESCENLA